MNIKHLLLALVSAAFISASTMAQSLSPSTKYHWDKGTLVVDTPTRPAGQQHVLGLTAPKMATVRVGFVGLGMRGPGAVARFTHIPGTQIVALCDYVEARAEACQKYLREAGLPPADIYSGEKGYEELCKRLDVDSLIDWLILEGVFANDDLTYANVRYCRSLENDGKWRVMFYDLDSTFYHANTCFGNLLSPWARDSRQVAQLIGALLRSPDFRDRLLTRAAELLEGPLSNERIIAEIDLLSEQIRPEVERDYGRFQMKVDDWEWNVQWLRDFILDNDWNQICVNNLCYYLNVGAEERARYFTK